MVNEYDVFIELATCIACLWVHHVVGFRRAWCFYPEIRGLVI